MSMWLNEYNPDAKWEPIPEWFEPGKIPFSPVVGDFDNGVKWVKHEGGMLGWPAKLIGGKLYYQPDNKFVG